MPTYYSVSSFRDSLNSRVTVGGDSLAVPDFAHLRLVLGDEPLIPGALLCVPSIRYPPAEFFVLSLQSPYGLIFREILLNFPRSVQDAF